MSLITISGSIGCEGEKIAQLVADGLNLELYDDQRLKQQAVKMGLQSDELKSLDEKTPDFLDRIWTHKPQLYLDLMEAVVYEAARSGQGVILGHGSQLLLRDFGCALHVLVYANELTRIERIMDRYRMNRLVAEKLVGQNDHERKGFFRFAFHKEWNDLSLYDLVINTEKLGAAQAAEFIMEVARSEKIQSCSMTALAVMSRLSLTKKIQAELLRNKFNPSMLHIEVSDSGVAYINGLVKTRTDRDRLINIVKNVPGVSDIQAEITEFIRTSA